MYPSVTVNRGKEPNSIFRHPWIFSGALVARPPDVADGDLVRVQAQDGRVLGVGTYSTRSSIAVRLYDFADVIINAAWFTKRLRESDDRRHLLGFGPDSETTGYRVAFGEVDGLPGVVLDRYADVLVLQISTAGAEKLRPQILAAIAEVFPGLALMERSDMPARREEGLEPRQEVVSGQISGPVEFRESGLKFLADPVGGQKTGFYLDQRDLRAAIRRLAAGRTVLNLFSYTGAAGVAALAGGAESVLNVDSSGPALAQCVDQAKMNKLGVQKMKTEEVDVFQYLGAEHTEKYGMVIIDPPAIIKSMKDAEEGRKAYHFLNRAALRLVEDGGLLVTSSCSHFFPEEDFAFTLRRASVQSNRRLDILATARQAADHPLSVYFPESSYLKSFIGQVRQF